MSGALTQLVALGAENQYLTGGGGGGGSGGSNNSYCGSCMAAPATPTTPATPAVVRNPPPKKSQHELYQCHVNECVRVSTETLSPASSAYPLYFSKSECMKYCGQ